MQTSLFTWSGTCPAWLSAPGGYECFQASLDWGWNRFHSLLSPGVLSTSHCCTSTYKKKKIQDSHLKHPPFSAVSHLYFHTASPHWMSPLAAKLGVHLFDMEEVLGLKGDGHAWHRYIIIVTRAVADICADSKCNWFGLAEVTKEGNKRKCQIFKKGKSLSKSKCILTGFVHDCWAVIRIFVQGVKITLGERYQQPLTHPGSV